MILTILYILQALCGLGIVWGIFMLFRNSQVYKFRVELIDIFADQAKKSLKPEIDYRWRSQMYHTVTYNQMVAHFWKPLKADKWWPDTSFLEPPK